MKQIGKTLDYTMHQVIYCASNCAHLQRQRVNILLVDGHDKLVAGCRRRVMIDDDDEDSKNWEMHKYIFHSITH